MSEETKEPQQVPLEVRLEQANLELERHQQLAGLYAQIVKNNVQLGDQIQIMLRGLSEIEQIKGSPPIQVARTIASRTIGEVAKYIAKATIEDKEEAANDNTILRGPGDIEGTEEHEAWDLPGGAD